MIRVKQICEELQATNGKKDKERILLENKDNDSFKQILHFLLNPFIVTGLSDKKINKIKVETTSWEHDNTADEFLKLLEYIKTHNTGRDDDIIMCQGWFCNFDNDMKEFIKSILTKSLKLGCDATTVNKIYGEGFIPTFDVMLGTSIEKCKIPENTWFAISHKLNGSRCVYYKGELWTRQGRVYTGLEHIKKDLQALPFNPHTVYDGELIRKNNDGITDSQNFQVGFGIANSKTENKEELKLVIFDTISTTDFENGKSTYTYKHRKDLVKSIKDTINQLHLENLSVVDMFYEGTDQSEIWKWLDYAEEHDLEGVILNLDTPYECKRTKNLIKVKKFYTLDLEIIGYEQGGGRLSGTLGALVVDFKGNNVNIGSGFDDATRKLIWDNRDDYIGRVIEIKYKEISCDKKTGLESLQFPIFQQVREIGKTVSYD